MSRPIALLLAFALLASPVLAGQVPGTAVSLTPPDGFVAANRFPGFMNESTRSSIMISEIPGPYAEVTAGFHDPKRLHAQGMKLLGQSAANVDGHAALLLQIEQAAYGTLFRKWLLAVDRVGATALIVATYPEAASKHQEASLRAAILAATFGTAGDPSDALVFSATPVAPFQVARVMGQTLILSPDGRFPLKDEKAPFMILGLSATEALPVRDQKAFAERRVTNTATVKDITVGQSRPVTIGDLSGYMTTASGTGEKAATPLTIYQVVLFDPLGYSLIQGVTPSADQDKYLPVFEKIARTFKLKAPAGKAVASDRK